MLQGVVFQVSGSVGPDNEPYLSVSLEQPNEDTNRGRPFHCTPDEPVFADVAHAAFSGDAVKKAGTRLFEGLCEHPEIKKHLESALLAKAGSRSPVYIELRNPAGAEVFPWEALCNQDAYLGLDERWALGRIVSAETPSPPTHTLTPPITIMALLSCLGVSATGELEALREMVASAPAGLVELHVVGSEAALIGELQEAIAAGEAPGVVSAELIPADTQALQTLVSTVGPHVLHFFCHGSADVTPRLELAVKSDWEAAVPSPGVWIYRDDFTGFRSKTGDRPWLVVLNCCEGAAPVMTDNATSMAYDLATRGFAHTVVGMREPVVSDVANAVTRSLYARLVTELRARVDQPGQARPVDWAQMLVTARDQLARSNGVGLFQAAAGTKDWTMPVVYTRSDEFLLSVVPAPADPEQARAKRLELEGLLSMLACLPPSTPQSARDFARARIQQLLDELGVALPDEVLAAGAGGP